MIWYNNDSLILPAFIYLRSGAVLMASNYQKAYDYDGDGDGDGNDLDADDNCLNISLPTHLFH